MTDLTGKVALVTGASSGLGAQFARVLAGVGATVVLAARRTDRLAALAAEIGARAHAVALDVTETAGIAAAVAQAEALAGPIDILVNNSGVSATHRLLEVTEAEWDQVLATNLKGAFFVAQAVARRMVAGKRPGRIVNVASAIALKPYAGISAYSISKAGVVQMTKQFALELARHGIACNAICPGYIETEINSEFFATEAGRKLVDRLPRKRLGQPEDLAGTLLLLAGDASGFLNGAVIAVDDGLAVS